MEFIENGIVLIAVVLLVEAIKYVLAEKYKRYLPLISIFVGTIANTLFARFTAGLTAEAVFQGIIIGGAAAGIYDFASKTVLNKG